MSYYLSISKSMLFFLCTEEQFGHHSPRVQIPIQHKLQTNRYLRIRRFYAKRRFGTIIPWFVFRRFIAMKTNNARANPYVSVFCDRLIDYFWWFIVCLVVGWMRAAIINAFCMEFFSCLVGYTQCVREPNEKYFLFLIKFK